MKKYIELELNDGEMVLIDSDNISFVCKGIKDRETTTRVWLNGDQLPFTIKCSYEEFRNIINSCAQIQTY